MESVNKLLKEVTALTFKIESEYPELYKHLDENPLTLPVDANPVIDSAVLQDYVESLKLLIDTQNHNS